MFTKNSIPGTVKTRLGSRIGMDKAFRINEHLVTHTQSVIDRVDVAQHLYFSEKLEELKGWQSIDETFVQNGNDLGERMSNAFRHAFESGAERVVIIGTDCIELRAEHLNEAFQRLEQSDLVIGPATDGGYYLLGMNKFLPSLFDKILWSTAEVLPQTVSRCKELALSFELLQELRDLDTQDDLEQLKHHFPLNYL